MGTFYRPYFRAGEGGGGGVRLWNGDVRNRVRGGFMQACEFIIASTDQLF
jgi:hypothetical protein